MNELIKYIPLVLRHTNDTDEAREQAIIAAWTVLVGNQIRQISFPVRVERKTLIVAVKNGTWRKQLRSMSGEILFKMNSLLCTPAITTLEFVINPDMIKTHNQSPHEEVSFIAPEKHATLLREKAESISNDELREAFLRAASKCLDRRFR